MPRDVVSLEREGGRKGKANEIILKNQLQILQITYGSTFFLLHMIKICTKQNLSSTKNHEQNLIGIKEQV